MSSCWSLDAVFPHYRAAEYDIISEQSMGFSGAKVIDIAVTKWERSSDVSVENDDARESHPPNLLFVKHIVFPELDASVSEISQQKDIRNRYSYQNETNFIDIVIPHLEKAGFFYFPKTHKVFHQSDSGENKSTETYTFVTDSLTSFAKQFHVFNSSQIISVLLWTARLHAVYHGTKVCVQDRDHVDALYRNEEFGIWGQGTHLAWEKRPSSEIDKISRNWRDLCVAFSWDDLEDVGERLAAVGPYIAKCLSSTHERNQGNLTIVHGDVKPANIFFMNDEIVASGRGVHGRDGCDITLIDYQWSGVALGVTDIIYLLATSASDDFIRNIDIERDVLSPYYNVLCKTYAAVVSNGKDPQYTFEELKHDYQLSVLDYVRWAVSCRLGGETPEKYAARREMIDVNLGSYRRSELMLRYLLQSVLSYLPSVENEVGI